MARNPKDDNSAQDDPWADLEDLIGFKTAQTVVHATFTTRLMALLRTLKPVLIVAVAGLVAALGSLLTIGFEPRTDVYERNYSEARGYVQDANHLLTEVIPRLNPSQMSLEDYRQLVVASERLKLADEQLAKSLPWNPLKIFSEISIFSQAHAAPSEAADSFTPQQYIRPGLLVFMVITITFFFTACITIYFRTSDPEKLKFAATSIQTILGFYIGVVTGLLGIPS